ncbi:MAG TPA: hypothetical protein VNA25_09145 [Phycisphaerae bacterium]|nr:hypothetical protein [Phycisphaerae bacterium]
MLTRKATLWLVLIALAMSLSVAEAAPISFDGQIDANDSYLATITDDANDVPDDDWDIATARFDLFDGWLWLGLEVQTGPIDTDGDHSSIPEMTCIYGSFDSNWQLNQDFYVLMDANGIQGVQLNGALLTPGVDYFAVLGTGATGGLEMKIDATKVFGAGYSTPQSLTFALQLDDTGRHDDDQVYGRVDVPEPMALCLLALGLPIILRRRSRR